MRLFSKVKPGTAFKADSENRPAEEPGQLQTRLAQAAQEEDKHELQVALQAASVAVDGRSITSYADQMKLKCLHAVAPLWTDGNLGDNNGLPERKTRIYIPEDMALPGRSVRVADCAREASNNGTAPAKKKRKGKAERNRLKREHEQALASNTAAMTSQ